jgi:hypothetical protein
MHTEHAHWFYNSPTIYCSLTLFINNVLVLSHKNFLKCNLKVNCSSKILTISSPGSQQIISHTMQYQAAITAISDNIFAIKNVTTFHSICIDAHITLAFPDIVSLKLLKLHSSQIILGFSCNNSSQN